MNTSDDMQTLCTHKMPARSCRICGAPVLCIPHRMPLLDCNLCTQQRVVAQHLPPPVSSSGGASGESEIVMLERAKDMVLGQLYSSQNGMVPLRNSYTGEDTLKAFGLPLDLFNQAFKALKDKRLVSPQKDGLHLSTAEKKRWQQAREKGEEYPPRSAKATGKQDAVTDAVKKLKVFEGFNAVMKRLNIPVFLTGGAVANMLYKSPRPIKDLDYRTAHYTQTFDQLTQEVNRINKELQLRFKGVTFKPLAVDARNKNVLDGIIDGCEVTLARILNVEDLKTYTIRDSLISGKDLILDKATTFIFRTDDVKKATDLFDLLWSMRHERMLPDRLLFLLQEERSDNYEKRVLSQVASLKEKAGYYAESLTTQLAISLGELMARGMVSVMNLLSAQVGNGDIVRALKDDLARLAEQLGVPFVDQPKGSRPMVILQAGNMTGDMFGVSAALALNPLAHVVLLSEGSEKDKTLQLQAFFLESLPPEDADRVHVLHTQRTEEPDKKMSTLYSLYSGREKKALPYPLIQPPLPHALWTPDLQQPISAATTSTAATWMPQKGLARMKEHWKVDMQASSSVDGLQNQEKVLRFLKGRGLPTSKRYLALWSRFSGKRGGPHAQHDTSFTGMRQMIHLALAEGYVVLIVGDQAKDAGKFGALAAAGQGRVLDLVEFWNSMDWKRHFPTGGRQAQFLLFEYLAKKAELKHLGSRSGNLEAYVLLGHQVRYMEEAGNLQAGRMEAWHSDQRAGIGYDRILLEDRVPSRTGQWVTEDARSQQSESKPPWVKDPLGDHKDNYIPGPLAGHASRGWDWKRYRAMERGYTVKDLEKIHAYLKHDDAESASGLETWMLELYRRHEEYLARGWVLGLRELDAAMQRRLLAFTAAPSALLPPWLGALLRAVHETPPEPE